MDRPLLNNPDIYPTNGIINATLNKCGEVYQHFAGKLPEHNIALEWRYYNDGKSWLGKAVSKKKTVFWVSVWDGFFRTSFYFTEKTRKGISALPVSDDIKSQIENASVVGKLVLLFVDVTSTAQLDDIFTLIVYKQSCK